MSGRRPLLLLHGISSREAVFWSPPRKCLGAELAREFRVLTGRLRWGRRPASRRGSLRGSESFEASRCRAPGAALQEGTPAPAFAGPSPWGLPLHPQNRGGQGGTLAGAVEASLPPCPPSEWDFDTYLAEDLPAIWAEACAAAGQPPIVLGYSMGGMLALLAQARGLIAAPALVLVATPLVFPAIPFYPPLMRRVFTLARRIGLPRIPTRFLGRLLIWLFASGRPSRIGPDLRLFHAQIRAAGVDVPPALLGQATAWVETGRLCDRTGTHDYLDELANVTVPTLFIAGGNDRIAPPAVVRRGFEAVASRHRECLVIPDGNHLTLANGPLAAEVAASVTRWVAEVLETAPICPPPP